MIIPDDNDGIRVHHQSTVPFDNVIYNVIRINGIAC